jgi:hypothetical protein
MHARVFSVCGIDSAVASERSEKAVVGTGRVPRSLRSITCDARAFSHSERKLVRVRRDRICARSAMVITG